MSVHPTSDSSPASADRNGAPARRSRSGSSRASKRNDLDRWFAFAFGVIFVSVLLYLATVVQNPSPLAIRVYITVLALAAAGVGAILPGFLEVRYKNWIRAGGALALGVLVYVSEPAIGHSVVNLVEPVEPAEPVAQAYLSAVDSGDLDRAWDMLPDLARQHVQRDKNAFLTLYHNTIQPLGKVVSRNFVGERKFESPPGAPIGIYRVLTYLTQFANDHSKRPEEVTLRGNSDKRWEMFGHQVSLAPLAN